MNNQNNQASPSTNSQTPTLVIPPEIHAFLEGLIEDAGMKSAKELVHSEMIKELYARLDNYLTTVIIDQMPPEHLETFIKMNEENKSKQEIEQFMKDKIPNSQDVFAKAFVDFRDLYLGNTKTTDLDDVKNTNQTN